jgi:O-antigen/teichoic acid export membrane protein
MPALGLMRMMWIAFTINSVVRMPVGSVLGAIGKVKFNAINSGITAACHLVLDYIFISYFGISGAAAALTIAYIGSGIANIIYLNVLARRSEKLRES